MKHGTNYTYHFFRCRCEACRAAWSAYQAIKVPTTCDGCGTTIFKSRSQVASIKSRKQPHTKGTPVRLLCPACHVEWLRESRKWPVNPRGEAYCRAPVQGGCNRLRRRASSKLFPFCHGHAKRKQRGQSLSTPIRERP